MANKKTGMEEHKFVLRLPPKLFRKLERASRKEMDSINRFVTMIIEAHLNNKDTRLDEILVNTKTLIQLLQEAQETKSK